MKNCIRIAACLFLALTSSIVAQAQAPASEPPPTILSMEIDSVKPYQGALYDKVAAEYPLVSAEFKQPTYYLAMESMSGSPQAAYLEGFGSFAAVQKDAETSQANSAMRAKFSALDAREAPYVKDLHNTIWHFRPDISNNPEGADLAHAHYWELLIFHMREGHVQAFEDLAKLARGADVQIGRNIHWAAYEAEGGATDAYLVLVPMTSLQDEDAWLANDKDYMNALGKDNLQHMRQTEGEAIARIEDNIWMVNPNASYVPKTWVDADPKYWGRKPVAKPASKGAEKAKPASAGPAQQ